MKYSKTKMNLALSLIALGSITQGSNKAEAFELEEVVVTAQKRSQSVQDIPLAVTGLTSDGMEQLGISNSNDISAQVPNMQVSGPFGDVQPIFSIRGISMSDYSSNQASPIGVYADEAYLGATYTHGLNFLDVERIEVLRGPQGTLYGKNTTGGAINIVTKTPSINEPISGNLKLGFGNYGSKTVSGAIENTLIEDVLAVRAAFKYNEDDGYYKNKLGGDDLAQKAYKAGRVAVNWQPTESLSAVLKYTAGKSDPRSTPPRSEGRIPSPSGGNVNLAGYQRTAGLDFHEGEIGSVGKTEVDMEQVVMSLTYDTENYSFVSITSWYDAEYSQLADTDGGPQRLGESLWRSDTDAVSQDLRIVSDLDGPLNFTVGLYYGKEDLNQNNIYALYDTATILNGTPTGDLLESFGLGDHRLSTTKESLAGYGQFRLELTDALGLDIGIRYTEDESSLDYLNFSRLNYDGSPLGSWLPGNTSGFNTPFIPPELDALNGTGFFLTGPYTQASAPTFDVTEREWSGKISLDYQFETAMVYISYSEGYRSGSFNGGTYYSPGQTLDDVYAEPEFIDAWEIGFKADMFDSRLRINGAAFYYEYENQQFINLVGISGNLENAGASEIAGIEFELWAQPVENLTLQTTIGWLDTEFTELELGRPQSQGGGSIDLKGNELISSPELNFSFSVDYDIYLSNEYLLRLHLDASYQDDQWFSAFNDDAGYEEIRQDNYWLYNARMSVEFGDASEYTLAVWGKNLTDEEYDTYALNFQESFGFDYFLAGSPRTYGLDFKYNF